MLVYNFKYAEMLCAQEHRRLHIYSHNFRHCYIILLTDSSFLHFLYLLFLHSSGKYFFHFTLSVAPPLVRINIYDKNEKKICYSGLNLPRFSKRQPNIAVKFFFYFVLKMRVRAVYMIFVDSVWNSIWEPDIVNSWRKMYTCIRASDKCKCDESNKIHKSIAVCRHETRVDESLHCRVVFSRYGTIFVFIVFSSFSSLSATLRPNGIGFYVSCRKLFWFNLKKKKTVFLYD